MTPKEKAEELFDKYATYAIMWTGGIEVEKQNTKQCALIAVDEIIQSFNDVMIPNPFNQYWQKVKKEIENL